LALLLFQEKSRKIEQAFMDLGEVIGGLFPRPANKASLSHPAAGFTGTMMRKDVL
jgi:hypothetical protein